MLGSGLQQPEIIFKLMRSEKPYESSHFFQIVTPNYVIKNYSRGFRTPELQTIR